MAILEVVLRQVQAGQELINRWNYYTSDMMSAGGYAVALTGALGGNPDDMAIPGQFPTGSLLRLLQEVQSAAVDFVDLSVRDIYSVTDFYETPFPTSTNGSIATGGSNDPLSPFVAYGFTSSRQRTDVRRGQKRFAGATEGNVAANGNIVAGFLDNQLTALAEAMSETLTESIMGVNVEFVPVVCGKEKYTTPSGKTAYRYYATHAAQLARTAMDVTWTPKTTVRSQVSRQYGRGR